MSIANAHRGEAILQVGGERVILRPSFEALVAAEEELGSLFTIVEKAAAGEMTLRQIAVLFDHLSHDRPTAISRERIGQALVEMGLAKVTPVLRLVLSQVLQGA